MTSPGIESPPDTPTRKAERSRSEVSVFSNSWYMVGTPAKIVHRCRSIASTAAAISKRGTSATVPPKRTATLSTLDSPKMWKRGRTARPTSSSRNSKTSPPTVQFMYSWKWVSSAPFGLPVVPLV